MTSRPNVIEKKRKTVPVWAFAVVVAVLVVAIALIEGTSGAG